MAWLRRLWYRFRYRAARAEGLSALELKVYKIKGGAAMLISCEEGIVSVLLPKAHALALIDTILDTVTEEEPSAPLAS